MMLDLPVFDCPPGGFKPGMKVRIHYATRPPEIAVVEDQQEFPNSTLWLTVTDLSDHNAAQYSVMSRHCEIIS